MPLIGLFRKQDMTEERMSKFENISVKTSKREKQRGKKKINRTENSRTVKKLQRM